MKNFFFGLLENIKQGILEVLGRIRMSKHPLWISFAPAGFDVKGHQIRKAMKLVEPGDVLVRRYVGYANGWFIPGRFSHSGIYVGDGLMIHALGNGVQKTDIIDFLQCDGFAILRPTKEAAIRVTHTVDEHGCKVLDDGDSIVDKAIWIAKSYLGHAYDFNFDICDDYKNKDEVQNRTKTVYCHELTRSCYPDLDIPTVLPSLWNGMIRSNKRQFLAQSFFDSPDFEVVYDSVFSEVQ